MGKQSSSIVEKQHHLEGDSAQGRRHKHGLSSLFLGAGRRSLRGVIEKQYSIAQLWLEGCRVTVPHMAKDPICGMTVDESSPLRAERDGQTYYFCSEHCRKKFAAQTQSTRPIVTAPTSN